MSAPLVIHCQRRCNSDIVGGCQDAACFDNCALRGTLAAGVLSFENRNGAYDDILYRPPAYQALCKEHYARWKKSWVEEDDGGGEKQKLSSEARKRLQCFKWTTL